MIILYTRVSTEEQNVDRQVINKDKYDYVFVDRCSGSIPLFERPKGSELHKLIQSGKLRELHIHSIDRLGRNTIDVLTTWTELTKKKIRVVCNSPSLQNIDENGNEDKFSELMISILSTLSKFERDQIRERQMEGIKIRKERGLYRGRKVETKDSPEKFLNKPKSKKIVEYLDKGYTYHEISRIVPCSKTTILKVKKVSEQFMVR